MKVTMSRDGKTRVSLRVDFRFDAEQMASLLALYSVRYGDVGIELSEKEVLECVKKQLFYSGTDPLDFGVDDMDDSALEWAKEQISKYWKEI